MVKEEGRILSLLAFGGRLSGSGVTSIQHYQPDTNKWVKVGDMPSPRYLCTCAVTNNGDILITGGSKDIYILGHLHVHVVFY